MCGRYTLRTPPGELAEFFGVISPPDFGPRFNIAPQQQVLALVERDGQRHFEFMRWGLVPSWADDPKIGNRMINARSETVVEKPSFRSAIKKRRCLLPADGYYEWQATGGHKQPYLICARDGKPLAFAGLYETWNKGDEPLVTCTILTTDANPTTRAVHDRMPVFVAPQDFARWLSTQVVDPAQLADLLRHGGEPPLALRRVSTLVNNPRNEDPRCAEELPAA